MSYLFATTLQRFKHSGAIDRVRLLELPFVAPAPHSNWDEVKTILVVLRAALREKALLLRSSSGRFHPDLLATFLLSFLPQRFRPFLALNGCMWQPSGGLRGRVERFIMHHVDRVVALYIVQSSDEVQSFPQTWGIAPQKVKRCLYHYTFSEEDLAAPAPPAENVIFSGGNSHRDYSALLEAARQMPDQHFFIATERLKPEQLPPNVTAMPVTHTEFVRRMRAAKAVVIPIRPDLHRAAGQQSYLNAMLLGKPTIVNDTLGVRDHIADRRNAFIVEGTAESYREALRWVLDPANQTALAHITAAGQRSVRQHFSVQHHTACLYELMAQALQASPQPDSPSLAPGDLGVPVG